MQALEVEPGGLGLAHAEQDRALLLGGEQWFVAELDEALAKHAQTLAVARQAAW